MFGCSSGGSATATPSRTEIPAPELPAFRAELQAFYSSLETVGAPPLSIVCEATEHHLRSLREQVNPPAQQLLQPADQAIDEGHPDWAIGFLLCLDRLHPDLELMTTAAVAARVGSSLQSIGSPSLAATSFAIALRDRSVDEYARYELLLHLARAAADAQQIDLAARARAHALDAAAEVRGGNILAAQVHIEEGFAHWFLRPPRSAESFSRASLALEASLEASEMPCGWDRERVASLHLVARAFALHARARSGATTIEALLAEAKTLEEQARSRADVLSLALIVEVYCLIDEHRECERIIDEFADADIDTNSLLSSLVNCALLVGDVEAATAAFQRLRRGEVIQAAQDVNPFELPLSKISYHYLLSRIAEAHFDASDRTLDLRVAILALMRALKLDAMRLSEAPSDFEAVVAGSGWSREGAERLLRLCLRMADREPQLRNAWLVEAIAAGEAVKDRALSATATRRALETRPEVERQYRALIRAEALLENVNLLQQNGMLQRGDPRARQRLALISRLPAMRSDLAETLPTLRWALADAQAGLSFLRADEALLGYFVAGRSIYVWAGTPHDVTVAQVERDSKHVAALARAAEQLTHSTLSLKDAEGVLVQLYDCLISPVASTLPMNGTLYISPHSFLTSVPFEVLLDRSSGRYLVENNNVAYTASLQMLRDACTSQSPAPELATAALCVSTFGWNDETTSLQPLTNTGPEIAGAMAGLAQLAGSEPCVYFAGPVLKPRMQLPASTGAFSTASFHEALQHTYCHITTHGHFEAEDWLSSWIILGSESGSRAERLRVGEMLVMPMAKAKLVVLSYCMSGAAGVTRGGDSLGLARPFIRAGVPSVIVATTRIPSRQAADFLATFYEHASCSSIGSAFSQTQRDMISQRVYPPAWLGWRYFGSTR
jgi:CHAT domain-containing protein